MKYESTLHAPFALLAIGLVMATLAWPGGLGDALPIDFTPLTEGISVLIGWLEDALHAEFWMQLVGGSDVTEIPRH